MQNLIALLPLKAHSERVPRKNFRPLDGVPLTCRMLTALLAVPEVDLVVINTDARKELAEIGVVDDDRILIKDRPPQLCGDLVSMNRIIADDLAANPASRYLMTHTTNPLISPRTLASALRAHEDALKIGHDSLFSVSRVQTRFYREDGSPVNHDPGNLVRTQDLEPWFEENSCLYVFDGASFARTGARIGARPYMFETPRMESVDIDDPEDWLLAEALLLRERVG